MDKPVKELMELADKTIAGMPNAKVYFKFTCPHCGARVQFQEPNTLYEKGECCNCGKESVITHGGFMLEINP